MVYVCLVRVQRILRSACLTGSLAGASIGHATHIVGGEMYYDDLGDGLYEITVKLYRDCSGFGFDDPIQIGVYSGANVWLETHSIPFPGATLVPVELDNPCLSLPPDVCIETTSYTITLFLPPIPGGYQLSFQRCCRTGIISNMPNPGALGLTVMCRIPGPEEMEVPANSSPRFNELPPVALCLGEPLVFDHSASDPDGDLLVYELCTPFNGGTSNTPQPVPSQLTAPPYTFLPWSPGYSATYPIDSAPAIAIDASTGELTLTPSMIGVYTVGVCVSEYRDGQLLSTTRRDFLFQVVPCNADAAAVIVGQLPGQFCVGLDMQFNENSIGADTYFWDFGDPATNGDTANVATPFWTYSAPGAYTVSLVVNAGLVCADTATAVFQVYFQPEPTFEPPEPICGDGDLFFAVEGEHFSDGATVVWDFGTVGEPPTAIGHQTGAYFPVGVHPVTVTATDNGCSGNFTANVVLLQNPTAGFFFDPDPPQIAGTVVTLSDNSTGNGATLTDWSWTANGNPLGSGPEVDWQSLAPGDYILMLVVTTEAGCTDTIMAPYTVVAGEILIPNVFTPNNDGVNDFFVIENAQYLPNTLRIYNRWGVVVHSAEDYRNNWRGTGLPDGTYYYVFKLKTDGSEHNGHVTLIR